MPSCFQQSVTAYSDPLHVLMLNIVIIPPSARLLHPSLRRAGVAFSVAVILHCFTKHRNACCQSSPGHIAQTRTQKASAFSTLKHRESPQGREAASCSLHWCFLHFPVTHSKPHKYLQGQSPVLTSKSSDLDNWHSQYTVISLEGLAPGTIFCSFSLPPPSSNICQN